MWRVLLAMLALLAVGVGVSWAEPPVDPEGDSVADPAADPAGDADQTAVATDAEQIEVELARLATAIDAAETSAEMDELFSQASRIDRDDPGVNQAYLRRALRFGHVQKAVYAARRLLKFSDREGVAFAVLAYYEADQGYLPKAFPEAVRAAEQLPLDPGVMHNAGALVAWFEFQNDVSYVPQEVRQALLLNQATWLEQPDFAASYEFVNALMGGYEMRIVEIQDMLVGIEESMATIDEKIVIFVERLTPIDRELRALRHDLYAARLSLTGQYWSRAELQGRIGAANVRIRELESDNSLTAAQEEELARLEEKVVFWERDLRNAYDRCGQTHIREWILRLRGEIRTVERERDELITEIRIEKRRFDALKDDRREADKQLDDIEEQKQRALGIRDRRVTWELPLVNGERIDLAALQAAARVNYTRQPAASTGPVDTSAAGRNLQLAKQYASGGRKDRAVELLEKILAQAPDSDQAPEAQELLNELTRLSPTN